jgi:Zn-dependent peptidase ImmA (M78 family)
MPKCSIYGSLSNLKLSELCELKKHWLTSMSSIIRKAKDLGCISQDRFTYLNIELSRRGWKTNEPFEVFIDEPTIYQVAYKKHKEDLSYDQDNFIRGFTLPIDVIRGLFEEKSKIIN